MTRRLSKKYRERLIRAVEVCERPIRGRRFDMEQWMHCGTVGCIAGWSAANPWFNREGLKLSSPDWYGRSDVVFIDPKTRNRLLDWKAVRKFFGLNHRDAEYLFGNSLIKRAVLARIRAFVEERGGIPEIG